MSRDFRPHILCIQPPVYDFALYDLFFKPYGLMRIAAWLEKGGYEVEFLNALDYMEPATVAQMGAVKRKANGTGKFHRAPAELPPHVRKIRRGFSRYGILPSVLEERIHRSRPDMVLVTSQMTYWYLGIREVVELLKKYHPDVPVAVGGVYATLMPEHCRLHTGADHVLQGDAFGQLPALLKSYRLPEPSPPSSAAVLSPLMKPDLWRDAGVLRLNTGCPYNCSYCASRLIEPRFIPGDSAVVYSQIEEMYRRFGIRNFAFYDDALLIRKKRLLLPLLEEIIRNELPVRFYTPNAVHIHHIDLETATLMKRAGFQEVRVGYESSEDWFHRELDGKYQPEEAPEAIGHLRRAGFTGGEIILYVLAGLPRQSAEEVEKTIREVASLQVRVSVAEYSPVPGTALWDASVQASRLPIAEEPLYHNNTFFPMEWENFSRDELERLKVYSRSLDVR